MTSFSSLIDKNHISTGFRGVQSDPTGILDVIPAAFNMTQDNYNTDSSVSLMREILQNNRQELIDAGLSDELEERINLRITSENRRRVARNAEFKNKLRDEAIAEARLEDPDRWSAALTTDEIRQAAREKANLSREEFERISAAATPFSSVVGGFTGSVAAAFTDPLNLGTMFFGAGAGRTVLRAAAIEAGVNMGSEAAIQPMIADWQKELNQEYGFSEAAVNVLSAGVMAGGLTLGIRGAKPTTRFVLEQAAESKFLPARARKAAKSMAQYVHIRDADPGVKADPESQEIHFKNIQNTARVFEEGRPIRADEVILSTYKPKDNTGKGYFDLSDVIGKSEANKVENLIQKEINKIKEELLPVASGKVTRGEVKDLKRERELLRQLVNTVKEEMLPVEKRKGLPARKAKQEAIKKGKKEAAKERAIYQEKIDEINRKLEKNRIASEAEANITRLDQGLIPEQYADRVSLIRDASLEKVRQVKPEKFDETEGILIDQGIIDQPAPSRQAIEDVIQEAESDSKVKAMEQDFERLIAANPNKTLTLDDGSTISFKQIAEDFKKDEKIIQEITSCAIGGADVV